ncbi:hypothetical protein [Sciscionella sediminilitoris]|uniref:PH-like domain-containing protein n=1 Tax=Sciscionella sediminilitoris TaxID=1445613 RepID=UPI00056898F6|nr:hypothetical protein [Sciscionella sp. SE31]
MERTLLVLALLAFCALCAGLMWLGFRNRRKRQADLPTLPAVPAELDRTERLDPIEGVYVSTTTTESWQDRVGQGDLGFRSRVAVHLYEQGVYFERTGAHELWIPRSAIEHVRTARGLAGKVMGTESLLVFRWSVEGSTFDTGVLADDPACYSAWLTAFGGELAKGEPR